MLTPEQIQRINQRLVAVQIIALSILMGALLFACVVFAIIDWNHFNHNAKLLTLIGAGTGVSMFVLAFVAANVFSSSSFEAAARDLKHNPDNQHQTLDECVGSLSVGRIMFSAIIEGAIFLNLMTFMLEQSSIALTIAAIGILMLMLTFPRKSRLIEKLSDQIRQVEQESPFVR